MKLTSDTGGLQTIAALFLAIAMAGVVGTALGFEHIGGFIPCKLCLAQREPYYAGVPVTLLAAAGAAFGWRNCFVRGMLVIAALLMSYSVILAVYHSGVEWHWWPGPTDCGAAATSGITTDVGSLLGALDAVTPPSCDEAAGRFLGLSFAGWNVFASLGLAAVAWRAALGREKL